MSDSSEGLDARSGLEEVEPTVDAGTPSIILGPNPDSSDEGSAASDSEESLQSVSSSDDDSGIGEDEEQEDGGPVEPPSQIEEDLGNDGSLSETDSDLELDEDRYQKLDIEGRAGFLDVYHPEAKVDNFEEVRTRSKVVRNSSGRIVDPEHKSLPILSKYELTRVLGLRAQQLDAGAQPLIRVPVGVLDGYPIAEAELHERKLPFIIRRPMPGGRSEYWRLQDLEVLRAPAGLGHTRATQGTSTSTGSRS